MDLFLLRHGVAAAASSDHPGQDSSRALTPEGVRKMQFAAAAIKASGLYFDLILSSPYLRATQTAELVAAALKVRRLVRLSAALAPQADFEKLVEELKNRYPERSSVLLVGHEPYLTGLVSLLASGRPGMTINLKKGGLCKLSVARLRNGSCAALDWLLTPKLLRRLA